MRLAIVAASLTLAACATTQQASTDLGNSLEAMIGQPVEIAVARLGEPIASAPMGADTVYGWGRAFTSTELSTPTSGAGIEAADFQGGVFPPPRATVQNDCVIRMVAGADGRIRGFDHRGTARGCRAYADRLAGRSLARLD